MEPVMTTDSRTKPEFRLVRDRKRLAGALEQRFFFGRSYRSRHTGKRIGIRPRWITTRKRKPKPGGHWASYWRIREAATGRTVVNFGRDFHPEHPVTAHILWEHGIHPEDAIATMKSARRPRFGKVVKRFLNRVRRMGEGLAKYGPGLHLRADEGRQGRVTPRGCGPIFGMTGKVKSRFAK